MGFIRNVRASEMIQKHISMDGWRRRANDSFYLTNHITNGRKIMTKLDGKVAIITGGSRGIGLAAAQRFVSEGAYVYITGRRQSELDAAVKKIGKNITAVQSDVSNLTDLDRLYATVKQHHDRIDVLFANAGGGGL